MLAPLKFLAVAGLLFQASLSTAAPAGTAPAGGDLLARDSADYELTLDIWTNSYCCGGRDPSTGDDCKPHPFAHPQVNPEITQRVGKIGACKLVDQRPNSYAIAYSAKTRDVGQKLFGRNLKIKWYLDGACTEPHPLEPVEDLTNKGTCFMIPLLGPSHFKLDYL